MTREEAIMWLNAERKARCKLGVLGEGSYLVQAIDMAIESLKNELKVYEQGYKQGRFDEQVENEPIRCKDCKWFVDGEDCIRHTEDTMGYAISTTAEDYCSRAERKEP